MLHVRAISRWRSSRDLAQWFLRVGFAHLLAGSSVMFRLEELRPNSSSLPIGLINNFTNIFDVYYLLGKVFWCACEFIAFTTYNICIDVDTIFSTRNVIHNLPYYLSENDMEEE
ncbi:Auxin-induced protein 5NG4 [Hordeum vulgare]|nr:Auxin-induced protein 5NG4 [Hordeum vulgare]